MLFITNAISVSTVKQRLQKGHLHGRIATRNPLLRIIDILDNLSTQLHLAVLFMNI